jgi:hypothetical protein
LERRRSPGRLSDPNFRILNHDGRLEVFYVGTDTAIYHNYQVTPNSGWNGEAALGGYAIQLTVAQNQDTRLEVFYVGTNQVIYHTYQTAPNNVDEIIKSFNLTPAKKGSPSGR